MSETWLRPFIILCLTTISTHSWIHNDISDEYLTLGDEPIATGNDDFIITQDGGVLKPKPEAAAVIPTVTWSDIVQLAKRYHPFRAASSPSSSAGTGQGQGSKSKQRVRYRLIPGHGFMGKRSSQVGDHMVTQEPRQEYDKLIAELNHLDQYYNRKLARVSELRKHLLRVWQFGF